MTAPQQLLTVFLYFYSAQSTPSLADTSFSLLHRSSSRCGGPCSKPEELIKHEQPGTNRPLPQPPSPLGYAAGSHGLCTDWRNKDERPHAWPAHLCEEARRQGLGRFELNR